MLMCMKTDTCIDSFCRVWPVIKMAMNNTNDNLYLANADYSESNEYISVVHPSSLQSLARIKNLSNVVSIVINPLKRVRN